MPTAGRLEGGSIRHEDSSPVGDGEGNVKGDAVEGREDITGLLDPALPEAANCVFVF